MPSITVANKTAVGISNISIVRKSDEVQYNLPKPSGLTLNNNIEVKTTQTRDGRGYMAKLNTYQTSEMPTLTITYGLSQPELFAFQTNYQMTPGSFTIELARNLTVPITGLIPAAVTGEMGFGTVADVGLVVPTGGKKITFGSKTSNTTFATTALTQAAYSATPYTTDDQFGVGDNAAYTFSTNLIGEYVTVRHPFTTTAKNIAGTLVGEVSIAFTVGMSDGSYYVVNIPSAIINPSGATLDSASEQTAITFDLVSTSCRAYTMYSLDNQKVTCK